MGIFKDIAISVMEKDEVELALEACGLAHENEEEKADVGACKKYMNPARFNDFAREIAKLMGQGTSYEEAKATVFDETEVPPRGSECCKMLHQRAEQLHKKPVKEAAEDDKKHIVQIRKTALSHWTDETPKLSLEDAKQVKATFDKDGVKARIVASGSSANEDRVVEK